MQQKKCSEGTCHFLCVSETICKTTNECSKITPARVPLLRVDLGAGRGRIWVRYEGGAVVGGDITGSRGGELESTSGDRSETRPHGLLIRGVEDQQLITISSRSFGKVETH